MITTGVGRTRTRRTRTRTRLRAQPPPQAALRPVSRIPYRPRPHLEP
jgi:hypothetical protein